MKELLQKYNIQAPRYTSYPPATEFTEDFKESDALRLIEESNTEEPENISLYFHFPYCPQLCLFCGCNSYLNKSEEESETYVRALLIEVDGMLDKLDLDRQVTQIHWGGGTPNSLDYGLMDEIMNRVLKRVKLSERAEVAIECNPAYLKPENIAQLRGMGFNRLSLGIQDFDPKVLKAVNREPSAMDLNDLMGLIRANNFDGVNFDFIYGLPVQTTEGFLDSLDKAISLQPDRLVTFSYAHVPWVKSEQKKMEGLAFPDPDQKLAMLLGGMEKLTGAGYQMIGMDHYARPEDPLGEASVKGQLHRNFQGYCTRDTTGQVYAFGASSISQLQKAYIQNIRHPEKYIEAINEKGIAVQRGYELSEDQDMIRSGITEVMCNGVLDFEVLAKDFKWTLEDTLKLFRYEPEKYQDLEEDGLLKAYKTRIELELSGRLLSRVIAMRLDPMEKRSGKSFSKII